MKTNLFTLSLWKCNTYQGIKLVIRPNTNMVTEAPQTAVLRPNLSDTRPAEKEPRAKPKSANIHVILFLERN